jgi:deazaflavin-dependent oxidoreductase (nitroreductase family)
MTGRQGSVKVPPRWFVRAAWQVHRAMYRVTGGRFGLRRPRNGRWGMFRLTTTGRRSGQERAVILAYLDDGPNIFTLAMNGWGDGEPAWWLNLQAHPDAHARFPGGSRPVRGRAAEGAERDRLWQKWRTTSPDLDDFAALRSSPTAVVVLEPRD